MKQASCFFWILLVFMGCKHSNSPQYQLQSGARRSGGYKGFVAVETQLKERVSSELILGNHLGDYNPDGLPSLLGAYSGPAGSARLQNDSPNGVNTMLWGVTMRSVAKDIAGSLCSAEGHNLNSHFYDTAKVLCTMPAGRPNDQIMQSFWIAIMRYDAPKSEMDAWLQREVDIGGIMHIADGKERVRQLTLSVLMNPYFLLQQ